MLDIGLKCPFCNGSVWAVVCDEEGNIHDDSYADDPWSGLSYAIVHREEDVPDSEFCPICSDELIGGKIYDNTDELSAAWSRNDTNVIVMPIDVGDILYAVVKRSVIPVKVREIKYVRKLRFGEESHSSKFLAHDADYTYLANYHWHDIGRTIFYTEQEAEAHVGA